MLTPNKSTMTSVSVGSIEMKKDVQSLMEVMTNTFIDPLSNNDVHIKRISSNQSISHNLQQTKDPGKEALTAFITERLSNKLKVSIYDPIKKLRLQTFSSLHKTVTVKCKDKTIQIKATRNLFG